MAVELDNILQTVKEGIGISATDTTFDGPLLVHINSIMMILNQLGVGPTSVFILTDGTELWSTFLPAGDDALYSLVKSYTILQVQAMFDPPTTGAVSTAQNNLIEKLESRLLYQEESQPSV